MKAQLQRFEGMQVSAAELKLNGATGDRIGALDIGEEFVVIVKGHVAAVNHKDKDGTVVREHAGKAASIILIDLETGLKWLSEAEMIADERFGLEHLFESIESKGPSEPKEDDGPEA